LDALAAVLRANPDHLEAHRWSAVIYVELNAVNQAVPHLKAVGRLDPEDGRPFRILGLFYKDYNRYEEAIAAYREALGRRLEPHVKAEVVEELGRLLVGQGRAPEALDVLARCPPQYRETPQLLAIRAECLWQTERSPAAVTLVERALSQAPDLAPALLFRAKLYLSEDRPQPAVPLLRRVLERDPHDHEARHQLADAYRQLGDKQSADEQLAQRDRTQRLKEELTKLSGDALARPDDDAVRFRIAEIWLRLGRPAEARGWLQAALALNPRNAAARAALDQLENRPSGR
jgi:tetratricopeptide (TPR) repeat protein